MHRTSRLAAAGVAAVLAASGCASSGGSTGAAPSAVGDTTPSSTATGATTGPVSSAPTTVVTAVTLPTTTLAPSTTPPGAVDPNAPEIVEPGDIPDNQVFIGFASADGVYSVKVPEGWARSEADGVVTFTDKYNSIALRSSPGATAPTVESVRLDGLSDVASDPTFTLIDVQPVTRSAGTGVLATYEIGSPPSAVTGKKALLSVERYVFSHNGTVVTMTLSGAKGADNVDPWRTVSDSLAWSR